jgi:D-beta-D-heptose 7-phosphate kinase/D-beta-D-heptose 1-phosphate adenosyltransferase
VFTNGCFDLLHRGHVQLLEQAKKQGTHLIVAVNTDASVRALKGDNRPVQDLQTRAKLLANLSCVDAVVLLDEEDFTTHPALRGLISTLRPDVLVKGAQYTETEIVGWDEMVNRDPPGRVWCCPMVDNCSTTQTIAKVAKNDK